MSEERRTHRLIKSILVNKIIVSEIIIDPHVDKHLDHINDELILDLVMLLDQKEFSPVRNEDGFSYFVSKLAFKNKIYRLVWLQQEDYFYIGVLTAFKDKGA
jgi:hypothetical protein